MHISQLTLDQEKEIIRDHKLLLVALCVLNQLTLEQIVDIYSVSKTECIQLLVKLDRIQFLELLPNNQVKLLVARTFSWLPEGPIQQYFKARAQNEYFRSRFGGQDELLLLVNGMLSPASTQLMLSRLKLVANEFSEMHNADAGLALGGRRPASLVVAMRPWELDEFRELRRRKPPERAGTAGTLTTPREALIKARVRDLIRASLDPPRRCCLRLRAGCSAHRRHAGARSGAPAPAPDPRRHRFPWHGADGRTVRRYVRARTPPRRVRGLPPRYAHHRR
jgi:hypothetical protein